MDIFKSLLGSGLDLVIPSLLIQVGMSLENKDTNTTGADDQAGQILVAFAPVVPALLHGDDKTIKRVLTAVYNTIGNYLGHPSV